jgi:hypothetical protein
MNGKPLLFLPIPRLSNASCILLFKEPGLVPAMIDSRVIGPCGGTSAGGIIQILVLRVKSVTGLRLVQKAKREQ